MWVYCTWLTCEAMFFPKIPSSPHILCTYSGAAPNLSVGGSMTRCLHPVTTNMLAGTQAQKQRSLCQPRGNLDRIHNWFILTLKCCESIEHLFGWLELFWRQAKGLRQTYRFECGEYARMCRVGTFVCFYFIFMIVHVPSCNGVFTSSTRTLARQLAWAFEPQNLNPTLCPPVPLFTQEYTTTSAT